MPHADLQMAVASKRLAKPLLDATNRLISKQHTSLAAVLLPQLLPKQPEFAESLLLANVDYLRRRDRLHQ
jgi:hypothetical protein